MMEENVVSAAGTRFQVQIEQIERNIKEAGYEPRRRNTRYELIPPADIPRPAAQQEPFAILN